MSNIIDDDKLNNIFNIDDIDVDDIDLSDYTDEVDEVETMENTVEITKSKQVQPIIENDKTDTDFVNEELKGLLKTTHKLMDAASFVLNGTPDAETIASASTLVNSIKDVIAEINKSVLIEKRFKEQIKLEKLKLDGKMLLEERKATNKKPELGSGNTFIQNTTNNTITANSQEDIIDMIRGIQKNAEQDIKKLK